MKTSVKIALHLAGLCGVAATVPETCTGSECEAAVDETAILQKMEVHRNLSSQTDGTPAAGDDALSDAPLASNLEPPKPLVLSDCKGCDFVADMSCHFPWVKNHYHRVMNCLLPHYSVVEKARQASGMRCFIGHKRVLLPFLNVLLGGQMPYRLIEDGEPCVKKLKVDAILDDKLKNARRSESDIVYLRFPVRQQLQELQKDVGRYIMQGAASEGWVVLLGRRGASRHFDVKGERALARSQRSETRRKVITFTGDEGVANTMRIFASASGAVGWHGAGLANSVFNSRGWCVVEMSTYKGKDCSDRTVWRLMNNFTSRLDGTGEKQKFVPLNFNPHVVWQKYYLPSRQLLLANNPAASCDESLPRDMDQFLEELKTIKVTSQNAKEVAAMLQTCLKS
mmetsp:Transcript_97264/g.253659  ORF Transcript_97264/g.253659 Transcript_97264/m.253659 type:complete len:396 (+) Transcript_97264:43-1230(+)